MSAAALREAGALRVGFAGTPEFAAVALRALQAAGFTLPLVLSQPDRPAGRGLRLSPSPVKSQALVWGLPVAQPRSLRLEGKFPEDALAAQLALSEARLDVLVVAAYGLILPAWVLQTPRLGCLNIHASLLPRWRGAAPIHRAIEAGDAQTGITVMQMDEGLDTGAMLAWRATAIGPQETTGQLHDRLAALGGEMIVETLRQAGLSALPQAVPQPLEGVCYAHKVDKAEAAIDWRWSAERIARRVRAFDPFPGASFECAGETVKLWSARSLPGRDEAAGTVLSAPDEPLVVACGDGALALDVLQRPGGKRLPVAAFLQARPGLMGQILPIPAPDH